MAENLALNVDEVPEGPNVESSETVYDKTYRKSVRWEPEIEDFVINDAGRMVVCNGQEAYKTWCIKMAMTERYQCLAYPDELGVELEEARQESDKKAAELAIERTITEAITVNPRTEYVSDFSFVWHGDQLQCSFKVKGINDVDIFSITI